MTLVVSKTELGMEIHRTLIQINSQIEVIADAAHAMGIKPYELVDHYGNYKLAPMLAAKAQALHALTLINQKE